MVEEAEFVVHEHQSGTMQGVQEVERHIGCDICRLRVMFKSRQVHSVCGIDIYDGLLAYGSWIEARLHIIVVAEQHVILRFGTVCQSQSDAQERHPYVFAHECRCCVYTICHNDITSENVVYCFAVIFFCFACRCLALLQCAMGC